MTYTSREFLQLLLERQVLSEMQVEYLQEQVDGAETPIPPRVIVRRLVERGYLNGFFAKNLLEEGLRRRRSKGDTTDAQPTPQPVRESIGAAASDAEDELSLAPLDDFALEDTATKDRRAREARRFVEVGKSEPGRTDFHEGASPSDVLIGAKLDNLLDDPLNSEVDDSRFSKTLLAPPKKSPLEAVLAKVDARLIWISAGVLAAVLALAIIALQFV